MGVGPVAARRADDTTPELHAFLSSHYRSERSRRLAPVVVAGLGLVFWLGLMTISNTSDGRANLLKMFVLNLLVAVALFARFFPWRSVESGPVLQAFRERTPVVWIYGDVTTTVWKRDRSFKGETLFITVGLADRSLHKLPINGKPYLEHVTMLMTREAPGATTGWSQDLAVQFARDPAVLRRAPHPAA